MSDEALTEQQRAVIRNEKRGYWLAWSAWAVVLGWLLAFIWDEPFATSVLYVGAAFTVVDLVSWVAFLYREHRPLGADHV